MPPGIVRRVAAIIHPHIEPAEYLALQARAGWSLDIELIDGEAVITPPAGGWASSVQGDLYTALRRWQEQTQDGGLLLQDVFVAMPAGQYLAPDIAWWSGPRRPPLTRGAIDSVPDLVVEVLSPTTRANDLGVKRDLYVSSSVRELWLADSDSRTITTMKPGVQDSTVTGQTGILQSELLPGFSLQLERLF